MPYRIATIEILVEADSYAEACDMLSEAMRSQLREFEPKSTIIDWRYALADDGAISGWNPHNGDGFEYA